jgi:hypothetical protein
MNVHDVQGPRSTPVRVVEGPLPERWLYARGMIDGEMVVIRAPRDPESDNAAPAAETAYLRLAAG